MFSKKWKKLTLICLGGVMLIGANFANKSIQEMKMMGRKKRAVEKQRQIMQDFWKEKGLTEEEIMAKMKSKRDGMTDEMKEEMREKMEENGSRAGSIRGIIRMHQ
jgi:hypothetical protein